MDCSLWLKLLEFQSNDGLHPSRELIHETVEAIPAECPSRLRGGRTAWQLHEGRHGARDDPDRRQLSDQAAGGEYRRAAIPAPSATDRVDRRRRTAGPEGHGSIRDAERGRRLGKRDDRGDIDDPFDRHIRSTVAV